MAWEKAQYDCFKKKYLEELKRAKEKKKTVPEVKNDCCHDSWQASFAWRV